jgi:hypothetical protein
MYKHIRLFYKDIIGIEFEENFIRPKEAVENDDISEFRKLAELITGIAAQCEKRADYLQIMQNMENEESTELFTILTERISAYTDDGVKIKDFSINEQSYIEEDEHATLYLKIEKLEVENLRLHEEIKNLSNKVDSLTKTNFTYELMIKEGEAKYQELVSSFEHKHHEHRNSDVVEDSVSIAIQISELKGKLEAKDKNLQKIKEEKEKIIEEQKMKLLQLQKDTESMREKSIKYDVLKEKMEKMSIDEINDLKTKLVQSDRIIKDQEDKIKKLKNYDVDKAKLLKKIEDLNNELAQHDEKNAELSKANNHYKDIIIQYEGETKFYKTQVEKLSHSAAEAEAHISSQEDYASSKITLHDLEEDNDSKKHLMDVEMKLKFVQADKDKLAKEKSDLEERLKLITAELEECKKEINKNAKKLDKYAKYKQEKHTYITKITDLMESLHNAKSECEALRVSKDKELSEIENKYLVIKIF